MYEGLHVFVSGRLNSNIVEVNESTELDMERVGSCVKKDSLINATLRLDMTQY